MSANVDRVESILQKYPKGQASLMPVLQDIHREFNYLPCEALKRAGEVLEVPLSQIFSVATFYKAFSLTPRGESVIRLCVGTACHVRGASVLYLRMQELLKIGDRQTTKDGRFTLELVNCVGTCAMAPVVVKDQKVHGQLQPVDVETLVNEGNPT